MFRHNLLLFYPDYATIYMVLFSSIGNVMKILQILFCILSCLCVAAAVFVGVFCGWEWFALVAAFAIVFAGAMFLIKRKRTPPRRTADYMNSPEENERISRENNDE